MKDIIVVKVGDHTTGLAPTPTEVKRLEDIFKKAFADAEQDVVVVAVPYSTQIERHCVPLEPLGFYGVGAVGTGTGAPIPQQPYVGDPIDLTPTSICDASAQEGSSQS